MIRGLFHRAESPPGAGAAWLRAALAFLLLNTLLTFENRWPGFGVLYMPRLSFELCIGVALLAVWVGKRSALSPRAATALALGFVLLVVARYADVTAPAVLGRPVNLYWDGRHALELLRLLAASMPAWRLGAAVLALVLGAALLVALVRSALMALAHALRWPQPRPWVLATVGALGLSFAAHVPEQRNTRWFFSMPLAPTLVQQTRLLLQAASPERTDAALGRGTAFDTGLSALVDDQGLADVLLLFAESYGAVTLDRPDHVQALQASRQRLQQAIDASGRAVVSARVRAATFGGASWLSHASLLSGIDASDPARHDLLMTSQRPTLVRHFGRHGYRTVGWMPGIKRPWPEGSFYGFDRLADDARIGHDGPDVGYWRIPDHAAMALLHRQELQPDGPPRRPVFAVFPTVSTHAPFHPLPSLDTASGVADEPAGAPLSPTERYLRSLRYQFEWLARYLEGPASRRLVVIVVGDHQPPLVAGRDASWDVPMHVIGHLPALQRRFEALGFVPGLLPRSDGVGAMHGLTQVLLQAFDGQVDIDLESAGQRSSQACTSPEAASSGKAASQSRMAPADMPCG